MSRCSAISTNCRGRSSALRRCDSFRIALSAAQAAKAFQPTGSREAADAALPPLVIYYRLLASAVPGGFDVAEAARLELDWWQARREAVGPGNTA